MAVVRTARIAASQRLGRDARLIDLRMEGNSTFEFRGGQYLIINTGAVLADDKPVKRAYSFASPDADQRHAQIIVKRLEGGPGSHAMHRLSVGDTVAFSGPWGKLAPAEDSKGGGRVVVLATDTGITAALGLVASRAFAARVSKAEVVWITSRGDDLLPESFAEERLARFGASLRVREAPEIGHSARGAFVRNVADEILAGEPLAEAFLVGDGAVLVPARASFLASGIAPEHARLECFFNAPPRP